MAAVNNNKPVTKPAPPPPPPPADKSKEADKSKAPPADKAQAADKSKGAEKANSTQDAGKAKEAEKVKAAAKPKDGFDSKNDKHVQQTQTQQQRQLTEQSKDVHALSATQNDNQVTDLSGGFSAAASAGDSNTTSGTGGSGTPSAGDKKAQAEQASMPSKDQWPAAEIKQQGKTEDKSVGAGQLLDGNGNKPYDAKHTYPPAGGKGSDLNMGVEPQNVYKEAIGQGATPDQASVLTAQMMQEGSVDGAKDGASSNYGIFNLNQQMLLEHGGDQFKDLKAEYDSKKQSDGKLLPEDQKNLSKKFQERLNPDNVNGTNHLSEDALKSNVAAGLASMNNLGADNYLHHVRGGDSGYKNPDQALPGEGVQADDQHRFARTIANNARLVRADMEDGSLSPNVRYAGEIPHLY